MMTRFKDNLINWLNASLSESTPSHVVAFCFNLNEPAGDDNVKYGVELIGAARYGKTDEDWACDDVWTPSPLAK